MVALKQPRSVAFTEERGSEDGLVLGADAGENIYFSFSCNFLIFHRILDLSSGIASYDSGGYKTS